MTYWNWDLIFIMILVTYLGLILLLVVGSCVELSRIKMSSPILHIVIIGYAILISGCAPILYEYHLRRADTICKAKGGIARIEAVSKFVECTRELEWHRLE